MDAAEADSDVKLYKASGELLAELTGKLPLLIRTNSGKQRRSVLVSKASEVAELVRVSQSGRPLLRANFVPA